MAFDCKPLGIEGLFFLQPKVFGDARGYFLETWNEKDFAALGIKTPFVQDNQSKSAKGVLRGLHFQKKHPQAKLVRVISGEVYDVAVDLRGGSPTFGQWEGLRLSGDVQNQFYIPAGFAHGFCVLSEEAVFAYKCGEFYHPEDEGGIRWDDPAIGIVWPDVGKAPLLSPKDLLLPAFDASRRYFDREGRGL